jgi:hypothetical protein
VAEHEALQLDEHLDFQRREWRVQRVGWFALAAFVLAALAGVFGSGPLSRAVATAPGLAVDYERFIRADVRSRLTIEMARPDSTTAAQLSISRNYFDAINITRIFPQPSTVELRGGEAVLSFERPEPGTLPMAIELEFKARRMGRRTATLRSGGATVAFTQLAYP